MKVNFTEIKSITLNKNKKKGKHKLKDAESKTKVSFEEKLNLGESENTSGDKQNKHESRSITEAPLKKDDKNVTNKLTKHDRKLEREKKKSKH